MYSTASVKVFPLPALALYTFKGVVTDGFSMTVGCCGFGDMIYGIQSHLDIVFIRSGSITSQDLKRFFFII